VRGRFTTSAIVKAVTVAVAVIRGTTTAVLSSRCLVLNCNCAYSAYMAANDTDKY